MASLKQLVKNLWSKDKETQIVEKSRGTSVGNLEKSVGAAGEIMSDHSGHSSLSQMLSVDMTLMSRYIDYEHMDDYPDTSVVLDGYSDDSTTPDTVHGKSIWATSSDKVVRDIIDDCLHRRIRIEEDIWIAVRTLLKYGNLFAELLIDEGAGIVGVNWLPTPTMRRIVDEKGGLIGFVQDQRGQFNFSFDEAAKSLNSGQLPRTEDDKELVFFHPWEVVHWRLRSKSIRSQYGVGILDSSRWIWKRLKLMEDTALAQKLSRSPGRYAFYIDTGSLPPKEAAALVRKVRRGFKKTKFIDPSTGELDFKYNPLAPPDDFWVPTRGGKDSTRIEVISGPDVQMMEDVEYFRNKLVVSTKYPRHYLGYGDNEDTSKTLSSVDVRFARACMRIQREFIVGVRKLIRIHLAVLNIDPDSVDWQIKMTVPSAIFEMQQIEVMNAQADLAGRLVDYMPKPWLLKHVFRFTDDDAAFITQEKNSESDDEMKREAATQADIMKMYPGVEVGDGEPAGESVDFGAELNDIKRALFEDRVERKRMTVQLGKVAPVIRKMQGLMNLKK